MQNHTPDPDFDRPGTTAAAVPLPAQDLIPLGYECALPWLHLAPSDVEPLRSPWPGRLAS